MDLDRFKEVNDTYGHQVGDELLVAMAERLTGILRPGDSLARLSGDEFVILCEDLADSSAADPIAVRLDAELSRPFVLSRMELTVTASIGIAFTGKGIESPEDLLRDADLAMYRAKRERGSRHDVLDLRQLHLAGHQAGLARSLPGAIARDELHLDYQPIVGSGDGRLVGVEALLRWTHPTRGPVSPTVFIPFAEQSGQIIELGRWVLEQACADRRLWQEHSSAEITMSVNVSAHQFMSAGFARSVASGARQHVNPRLLVDPGGHRERARRRRGARSGRARRAQRDRRQTRSGSTSGPATPRSGISTRCRSTSIKIDPIFIGKTEPRSQQPRRSSPQSSASRTLWGCLSCQPASRTHVNTRKCNSSALTVLRVSTSPRRCWRPLSRRSSQAKPTAAPATSRHVVSRSGREVAPDPQGAD